IEPGSPAQPTDALQAQPGNWDARYRCSACREGDVFLPWMYPASSGPGQVDAEDVFGVDPSTVHLYQGSQEVPLEDNVFGASEYKLPAASAQYRLTLDQANTHTAWDFPSAQPVTDQTPDGFSCGFNQYLGGSGPCAPQPLVFVRYDAGVDL